MDHHLSNGDKLADQKHEPTIAPSMEDDPLEEGATSDEIEDGEFTPVTKLFLDRI